MTSADPRDLAASQAKAAYIAEHPEPRFEDFPCPQCKAPVGQPCTFSRPRGPDLIPCHAPRYDRRSPAHTRWFLDVDNVYWEAWEAADRLTTKENR